MVAAVVMATQAVYLHFPQCAARVHQRNVTIHY